MGFRIIISPAKRMVASDDEPRPAQAPRLIEDARTLTAALLALGREDAQRLWRCSDALAGAAWAQTLALDEALRQDPTSLTAAVTCYNGIQYTHLAAAVMSTEELAWLEGHLRIVSGMYGVLRPLDGVAPYRLEMQARLAPKGARNLYEFWGDRICKEAIRGAGDADGGADGAGDGATAIVNVASAEYARAVLPAVRAAGVRVITCGFFAPRPRDGKLVQAATEAKATRGGFVRWAAERRIGNVEDLRRFDERGYVLDQGRSSKDDWVFIRR
ncbi:YaaA family protein [Olsenella sp. HMSC062G07]|uniref:YaaA family protein n=1 Tax=Olsenella sp. HMSC062G07 TaxID=1739330 RepID=UPI0008A3BF2E|nr:YaaA family protein [Olsenella sp. HMSC062G07]OFK24812.1 hypothetical protein HMPREF2826_06210 [Olsenella sp. HMSC062G07]